MRIRRLYRRREGGGERGRRMDTRARQGGLKTRKLVTGWKKGRRGEEG